METKGALTRVRDMKGKKNVYERRNRSLSKFDMCPDFFKKGEKKKKHGVAYAPRTCFPHEHGGYHKRASSEIVSLSVVKLDTSEIRVLGVGIRNYSNTSLHSNYETSSHRFDRHPGKKLVFLNVDKKRMGSSRQSKALVSSW